MAIKKSDGTYYSEIRMQPNEKLRFYLAPTADYHSWGYRKTKCTILGHPIKRHWAGDRGYIPCGSPNHCAFCDRGQRPLTHVIVPIIIGDKELRLRMTLTANMKLVDLIKKYGSEKALTFEFEVRTSTANDGIKFTYDFDIVGETPNPNIERSPPVNMLEGTDWCPEDVPDEARGDDVLVVTPYEEKCIRHLANYLQTHKPKDAWSSESFVKTLMEQYDQRRRGKKDGMYVYEDRARLFARELFDGFNIELRRIRLKV